MEGRDDYFNKLAEEEEEKEEDLDWDKIFEPSENPDGARAKGEGGR